MGLNALYINLAGREENGIVSHGAEQGAVIADLRHRLLELRDPASGKPVVADVTQLHSASRFAPDLIVGYEPGYRASWETALGGIPIGVIRENTDAWLADHCISAAAVPGVLIGTRTPHVSNPKIKDVTVTVLHEFGLQPDAAMTGRGLY